MHPYFRMRYSPTGDLGDFRFILNRWQGDETIGHLMACAKTRVQVLYDELRKSPSGTLHNLFQELWESATDPLTAPTDQEVQRIWNKLDDTIVEARQCVFEITGRYGEREAELYYHAAEVVFALEEVKRQINGQQEPLLENAIQNPSQRWR